MSPSDMRKDNSGTGQSFEDLKREREQRMNTYRERALKLFPWVCGRCGREFSGKRLKELTVHHKDRDHDNNPLDGSNWELLCIYCHENEHARNEVADWYEGTKPSEEKKPSSTYKPFEALEALLKEKK